jgi:hypothetical protein
MIAEKVSFDKFEELVLIHGRLFEHLGVRGGDGEKSKSSMRNGAHEGRRWGMQEEEEEGSGSSEI